MSLPQKTQFLFTKLFVITPTVRYVIFDVHLAKGPGWVFYSIELLFKHLGLSFTYILNPLSLKLCVIYRPETNFRDVTKDAMGCHYSVSFFKGYPMIESSKMEYRQSKRNLSTKMLAFKKTGNWPLRCNVRFQTYEYKNLSNFCKQDQKFIEKFAAVIEVLKIFAQVRSFPYVPTVPAPLLMKG